MDEPVQDESSTKSVKLFLEEEVEELTCNPLYAMGMMAWGKQHQKDIARAVSMTAIPLTDQSLFHIPQINSTKSFSFC